MAQNWPLNTRIRSG